VSPSTTRLHLTIQTASGSYSDQFNGHEQVRAVIKQTVAHLHLHEDPANPFVLEYNGQDLVLDSTLYENHIPDGATLTMRTRTSGGG
jgi:hypothetical protein